MRNWRAWAALVVCGWGVDRSHAADFIWIEGERGGASVPANVAGWGNADFLSDGKWLHLAFEGEKLTTQVPAEGIRITYPFQADQAGRYEVWARIGFEFARTPFEWRVDTGDFQRVTPDDLTTDLMEIDFWCEVAWLKLGQMQLARGPHQLEIRVLPLLNEQGQPQRLLAAFDCFCLTTSPFRPNSKFPPDQTGQDAADRAAVMHVFHLPSAPSGQRAQVALAGTWAVARDDEQLPGDVAAPIATLPDQPIWRAIPVPSDKNVARKDLVFAHRLWYRTQVEVPEALAGRAFFIDFPLNNLNTTVYVNGQLCGFFKDPFARFQMDVTRAVKPGQTNEILVGIRDAWYGRSADPQRPLKLRKTFNLPLKFFGDGFQDLDYPIWNCPQSGILCTPTFVAAGSAYASDVFLKPSVERQAMEVELTVANTADQPLAGVVRWWAIDDATGQVAQEFPPARFRAPAAGQVTVPLSAPWASPRLWWPEPHPALYRLRAQLVVGEQVIDTQETLFGFREWKIDGIKFTLNGVPWRMWADLSPGGETPDEVAESYHRHHIRTYRYSTAGQSGRDSRWQGLEPPAALEFFDRQGMVVRRNMTLDGQVIGNHFSEQDPITVQQQNGSQAKLKLMANWLDQCVAQVKGERNHPCVQIWSIENEFAYINLINLLGNSPLMDEYEGYIKRTHDAVLAVDPTRSVMIDGGGALKDNSLSVHGDHYVATFDQRYPDLAYQTFAEGGGRGRWRWDQQRPRFLGEDYYATGINPADYALWGGEVCFQGKAATRDAMALMYRMLQEGYRWNGEYAAWHFWIGGDGGPAQWVANAPRLALVREWDWTFGSGQQVRRTFGVFNDSQHTEPIRFTRTLTFDGRETYTKTTEHVVAPGSAEKFEEVIPLPTVTRRTEGELHLSVRVNGQEVFQDTKAVSVLPPPALDTGDAKIALYDPRGSAAALLVQLDAPVTRLSSLEALPADARLLLVGSDALTGPESTATTLAAFAAPGRAVVVLDQSTPLKYQAIPAEMELAHDPPPLDEGRIAFLEDTSHPALAGLRDKDFFTWPGPDSVVYRQPYVKPTRGGKSLVQVGRRLGQTAMVEIPVGKGVMYLTQLRLGDQLDQAVAAQVVVNLINAAAQYRQVFAPVVAVVSDPQLTRALDAVGVQYDQGADPVATLRDPGCQIALLSATPETLRALAGQAAALQSFWDRGGTILFHGLTPAGLADFNRIVGVEHVIRPFRRERVVFPAVRNPLTSGLTSGDVVMLSGERMFSWTADEYVASDVFTHVVSLDDIAPFSTSTFFGWDHMVNGFVGSDGWPLIMDFPYPEDGSPYEFTIRFPGPYPVREYIHDQSINYNATTRLALLFDGQDRQEFALTTDGEEVVCAIDPPHTCRELTVQLLEWARDPAKAPNIGMDNIRVMVQPSQSYVETVRPMLNIGGLVQYVKGAGGVVLCNVNFKGTGTGTGTGTETESVPVNATKKRTILATVLRNLRAPFAGGKAVIAGGEVDYFPVDIHTRATTYKDERGFFGDARRTLKSLPAGRNTLAGVVYDIYEMPTSPVPQILMLGGQGVPLDPPQAIRDIPVNVKADALFFLHTARIGDRPDDRQRREKQYPVMFQYVVHYSDGQTVSIPVRSELEIDHYVQPDPQALPGAQLAWTARYEQSDDYAAAYAMQWNNPRPDTIIRSIDMEYVDGSRGVPALVALTAATGR